MASSRRRFEKNRDRGKVLDKIDVKSMSFTELREDLGSLGLPAYRADQVFHWLH